MKYLQRTFTLPANVKKMKQEDWEVAVGLRCPDCKGLMAGKHKCSKKG